MTEAVCDPITGYLAALGAGLRVPTAEAELILAEAEDHLRETAAAAMAVGMTELAAQQAAVSSFGPVRAVLRAHRRRLVTGREAAMAAWKLIGLLATTVGAGGLAGLGIFAYLMRFARPGRWGWPGRCRPGHRWARSSARIRATWWARPGRTRFRPRCSSTRPWRRAAWRC